MKLRRIIILLIMLAITASLVISNLQMSYRMERLYQIMVQTQNNLGDALQKDDALTFYIANNLERKPNFEKLQKANVQLRIGRSGGAGTVIGIEEDYTYVLTAEHCTPQKKRYEYEIEIPMKDKDFPKQGKGYLKGHTYIDIEKENIYRHKKYDVALIRFPTVEGHDLEILLPSEYPAKIGDTIYAVGNPMSLTDNITKGILSAKVREETTRKKKKIAYTIVSSGIIFGNSGGAIVNQDGEIIGVVVEIEFFKTHPLIQIGYCVPRHVMIPFVVEALNALQEKTNTEKN